MISVEDSTSLKKELLVSVVPSSEGLIISESQSDDVLFAQKPTAFDPLTGSITVPYLMKAALDDDATKTTTNTDADILFRFCVRNSARARQDLMKVADKVKADLIESSRRGNDAIGTFLLGSTERGIKVFRVQDSESNQFYASTGKVALGGLFGSGAFVFSGEKKAIMYVPMTLFYLFTAAGV